MNTQRILVVPFGMPEGDIYKMLEAEGCCAFWTKPDCISAYVLVETWQGGQQEELEGVS